jgi:hypothetical protein
MALLLLDLAPHLPPIFLFSSVVDLVPFIAISVLSPIRLNLLGLTERESIQMRGQDFSLIQTAHRMQRTLELALLTLDKLSRAPRLA